MRRTVTFVIAGWLATAAAAWAQSQAVDPAHRVVVRDVVVTERARVYQGRNSGPEETERVSRKVKLARDGRVSVANVAGDIVVTVGGGDEVSIEAVKRTRGARSELARVRVEVEERSGRVDIRTEGEMNRTDRNRRTNFVSVDYTIVMPAGASLDAHSVSGSLKVTGVKGSVRGETISGDVVATDTPKLEFAKSTSGNVTVSGASMDGELSAASISGSVTVRNVKAHGLDLGSITGDVRITDATCDRLGVKSVSGSIEYAGTIARAGRYELNTHSGTVRLTLANPPGFELNANSFSGSVRSDFPMTIGGTSDRNPRDRSGRRIVNNRAMRATYGDGSATLTIRTFSGDIVIAKK